MDFLRETVLGNTLLLNLISLIVGLTGVALAFIFYFKSKPSKSISSATRTFKVITERSEKIPNLEIKISGENTSVVTLTRLSFWNSGNLELKRNDVADANPLRISKIHTAKIFNIELVEQTNPANQVIISQAEDPNSYYILFDYYSGN